MSLVAYYQICRSHQDSSRVCKQKRWWWEIRDVALNVKLVKMPIWAVGIRFEFQFGQNYYKDVKLLLPWPVEIFQQTTAELFSRSSFSELLFLLVRRWKSLREENEKFPSTWHSTLTLLLWSVFPSLVDFTWVHFLGYVWFWWSVILMLLKFPNTSKQTKPQSVGNYMKAGGAMQRQQLGRCLCRKAGEQWRSESRGLWKGDRPSL